MTGKQKKKNNKITSFLSLLPYWRHVSSVSLFLSGLFPPPTPPVHVTTRIHLQLLTNLCAHLFSCSFFILFYYLNYIILSFYYLIFFFLLNKSFFIYPCAVLPLRVLFLSIEALRVLVALNTCFAPIHPSIHLIFRSRARMHVCPLCGLKSVKFLSCTPYRLAQINGPRDEWNRSLATGRAALAPRDPSPTHACIWEG